MSWSPKRFLGRRRDRFPAALKDVLAYGIGDFLVFGGSFLVLTPALTRALGPGRYGQVAALSAVSLFLQGVLQCGLPSAALRIYFSYPTAEQRARYFAGVWISGAIIATAIAALLSLFARPLWDLVLSGIPYEHYGLYIIWGAVAQLLVTYQTVLLRAEKHPSASAFLQCAQFVVMTGAVIAYVVIGGGGVAGYVHAVFWTSVAWGGISLLVLLYLTRPNAFIRHFVATLPLAGPIGATYLVGFFSARSNVLIVQHYWPGAIVGVYAIGQQIGGLLSIAAGSLEKAWQPTLYAATLQRAGTLLARVHTIGSFAAATVVFLLTLWSSEIVTLLASRVYLDAWILVALLTLANALLALSSLLNAGIYYAGRSGYTTAVATAGAALNVLLNLLLVPWFAGIGAAVATVVASACVLGLTVRGVSKYFGVSLSPVRLLRPLVWGVALASAALGLIAFYQIHAIAAVLFIKLVTALVYVAGTLGTAREVARSLPRAAT